MIYQPEKQLTLVMGNHPYSWQRGNLSDSDNKIATYLGNIWMFERRTEIQAPKFVLRPWCDVRKVLAGPNVASSIGLWMRFEPVHETIAGKPSQPIRYIVADIPEGITAIGSGKMIIASETEKNVLLHKDIYMALLKTAAYEIRTSPIFEEETLHQMKISPSMDSFFVPEKGTLRVLGGGFLAYSFKRTFELELSIDPDKFSRKYEKTPDPDMHEVISRINSCEGVSIRYGCSGNGGANGSGSE